MSELFYLVSFTFWNLFDVKFVRKCIIFCLFNHPVGSRMLMHKKIKEKIKLSNYVIKVVL